MWAIHCCYLSCWRSRRDVYIAGCAYDCLAPARPTSCIVLWCLYILARTIKSCVACFVVVAQWEMIREVSRRHVLLADRTCKTSERSFLTKLNFSNFYLLNWQLVLNYISPFLSRVRILTRDIDIANLSVRLSVRYVPVSDENGLTYRHRFLPYGSPIILVLPASNIFTKFRRGHPLQGR